VSNEVKSIVRIYKEVAKVDAKGLTKTDFRNLLFKTEPGDRRRRDTKFRDEVCGDMFRALDKDRDGYVMLEDLLKHFVPPAQLKRMPRDFIASVFRRKKVVVEYTETPRLPEENKEEIREVYELWAAWAQESGNRDGKLDREALIDILAGQSTSPANAQTCVRAGHVLHSSTCLRVSLLLLLLLLWNCWLIVCCICRTVSC
jgi:hypothetical protein